MIFNAVHASEPLVQFGIRSFLSSGFVQLTSLGCPKFTIWLGIRIIFVQVVFQKAMKTASVFDLKSDLKKLFVNRYIGRGFKLPVLFNTGEVV